MSFAKTIVIFPLVLYGVAPSQEIPIQEKEVHGQIEVIEILPSVVTAYTSSRDETDADPFTTASGEKAGPGIVACPSRFEFGTAVEIEGRDYVCGDRMHRRFREQNRFDVWSGSKAEAREWGKKTIEVRIKTTI